MSHGRPVGGSAPGASGCRRGACTGELAPAHRSRVHEGIQGAGTDRQTRRIPVTDQAWNMAVWDAGLPVCKTARGLPHVEFSRLDLVPGCSPLLLSSFFFSFSFFEHGDAMMASPALPEGHRPG